MIFLATKNQFSKTNDFNIDIVYIDTAQELLVKQIFIAIQMCSIKLWSPQHTHAPGATRLRSPRLHAPQPDSAHVTVTSTTVLKDVHMRQMWTVGV